VLQKLLIDKFSLEENENLHFEERSRVVVNLKSKKGFFKDIIEGSSLTAN